MPPACFLRPAGRRPVRIQPPRKNTRYPHGYRTFLVGEGGFAFLRKSHGGCGVPPARRQELPFESTIRKPIPAKSTILTDGAFYWWGKVDSSPRTKKHAAGMFFAACWPPSCSNPTPTKKYPVSTRIPDIFGGGRWIRTTEVTDSRFTVCPLWPLGNSPILICAVTPPRSS